MAETSHLPRQTARLHEHLPILFLLLCGIGLSLFLSFLTRSYLTALPAWFSWAILAAGLLLTFVLCAYVDAVLRRTAEVERLVAERTQEL